MTRDQMTALFARRQDAMARLDVDVLTSLHAEDGTVESPFGGGVTRGRAHIADVYRAFFAAFTPTFERLDLLIDGTHAVDVERMAGTDHGGVMGLAPTGRSFSIQLACVCECAGGLIVHERRIYDFTGLLVQLGVLKAKPA